MNKVHTTRDKYSSTPTAKTNWDPYAKNKPPPPPSRAPESTASSRSSISSAPPPPVHSRPPPPVSAANKPPVSTSTKPPPPVRPSARPSFSSQPSTRSQDLEIDNIDWANLSEEDKQVFFSWLDEFFSRHLGKQLPDRGNPHLPARNTASAGDRAQADAASHRNLPPALGPMSSSRGPPVSHEFWNYRFVILIMPILA